MKAFFGRNFQEKDDRLVATIAEYFTSLGIECINAKPAQNKPVNNKIKELIHDSDIFVGIFTCDQPICQMNKKRWFCYTRKDSNLYTTSNWVIQESGFALGLNKPLILFVEKGVDKFPGLQGDLEYIPFDREDIGVLGLKINQMVRDIKKDSVGRTTEISSGESTSPEDCKLEKPQSQPKESTENKKSELFLTFIKALNIDKDYIKAQKIFDEELESTLDTEDRVPSRAYLLRKSHSLGDQGAFEKLQQMVKENADNPRIIKHLAYRYKEMSELTKAKEQFLLATEKYDVNDTTKKSGLIEACPAFSSTTSGGASGNARLRSPPRWTNANADRRPATISATTRSVRLKSAKPVCRDEIR